MKSSKHVKRDNEYKCDKCDKIFTSKTDHASHVKNSYCNMETITIHIDSITKSKLFKCKICGTSFPSKKSCIIHCNSAHIRNQKEVQKLLAKSVTKSYRCNICEKTFSTVQNLRLHEEWHGEFNHKCDICHKMFPSKNIVNSHKRKQHVPKTLVCRWNCGETFTYGNGRMKHEKRNHYETNPLERICDICGKPCLNETSLRSHKKTHLNPSERISEYKCSICSEVFQKQEKVTEHRKLVHYDEKFTCSKCNKIFALERNFKIHMEKHESGSFKKHNGNYTRSCHQCSSDQKYSISSLRRHLKSKHSVILKCKEYGCQKTFWHEERYQWHVKKHQDSKCHICYLVLSNPMNARIHLIGVHKLTIEDLIKLGRYNPNAKNIPPNKKRKDGGSWMNRFVENSKEHKEFLEIKYKKCTKKPEDHDKSVKIYNCEKCTRHFHKEWTLKSHIKNIHEDLGKFKCDSCEKYTVFRTQGRLNKHMKKHDGQKFTCEIENCEKICSSRNEINNHILNIHGYFKCNYCELEYPRQKELKKHIEKDHKNEMFKCEFCNTKYNSESFMFNQQKCKKCENQSYYTEIVHEGKTRLKCKYCDYSKTQFHLLKYHIEATHDIKLHRITKLASRQRIKKNIGKYIYKCHICENSYTNRMNLKYHIDTLHGGVNNCAQNQFKCGECSDSFPKPGNLKMHIHYVHGGLKNIKHYKCDICKKLFSREDQLKLHINTTHDQKKPICESCGKSFFDASTLRKHIHTVHERFKGHKCETCDRSFIDARTLKNHIDTHCQKSQENVEQDIPVEKSIQWSKINKEKTNLKSNVELNRISNSELSWEQTDIEPNSESVNNMEEKWLEYLEESTIYQSPTKETNTIEPGEIIDLKDHENELINILESEDLPEGWEEINCPDGKKLYINLKTRQTQWEDPRISLLD